MDWTLERNGRISNQIQVRVTAVVLSSVDPVASFSVSGISLCSGNGYISCLTTVEVEVRGGLRGYTYKEGQPFSLWLV